MRMRLDPGVSRLRSRSSTEEVVARLTRAGWDVRVVDVSKARDKAGLLDGFARALSFPSWVGRNWDALEDCLTDLDWLEAAGYVLVLTNVQALLIGESEEHFKNLVEILAGATKHWSSRRWRRPFRTIFHLPHHGGSGSSGSVCEGRS